MSTSYPIHEYEEPLKFPSEDSPDRRKGLRRRYSDSALADLDNNDGGSSVASSWAPATAGSLDQRRRRRGPDTAPSSPRRRQTTASTPEKQKQQSIPDKLAQSALSGTLELLKLAGGVTLSTTGKLAAPPIYVTRTLILPALWEGLQEYLHSITPVRVKDWFRIVSSSCHHLVTVLKNTQRGAVFREKIVTVGGDIVDCVSSDISRQALIDGMASVVKLSEALHTPEMKALLEQLSVLGCRIVDVASSGRNKKLLHDVSDATWAGLELVSDPAATLAMAEVTAYLCHALEMEDSVHRGKLVPPKKAAQKRYQRNQYQRQTYVDPSMVQDANSTIEQVMLSSLGGGTKVPSDDSSLPSNIHLKSAPMETTESERDWAQQLEGVDTSNWREDVDLAFLNERLALRAGSLERQKTERRSNRASSQPTADAAAPPQKPPPHGPTTQAPNESEVKDDMEDLIVTTVQEESDDADDELEQENRRGASDKQNRKPRGDGSSSGGKAQADDAGRVGLAYDTVAELPWEMDSDGIQREEEGPTPLQNSSFQGDDGEPATSRFYRNLDEIMTKKRSEAIDGILANEELTGKGLSWFPKAAAAAGVGNERGQDTIKSRLHAMRESLREKSEIGVGRSTTVSAKEKQLKAAVMRGCIGVFHLAWFVFGCFGLYAVFFSSGAKQMMLTTSATTNPTQEVVVRIVRQVVHMTPEGEIIQTTAGADPPIQANDVRNIAECVADLIDKP